MNTSNEYGWFYDLECPPDHAAVEYHRVKSVSSRRVAYQVRHNRLWVAPAKPLNDEFILTECTVPSSETPHIIEIPEPVLAPGLVPVKVAAVPNKRDEHEWDAKLQFFGSLVAGMVCYGVITA
jgi:hypothetical protein